MAATPVFSPADFSKGQPIDNKYLTYKPGTTFEYQSVDGDGNLTETRVLTVTNKTKVIDGVTCIVVTDVAKDADGTVIERTEDYFAQDKSGNVWYFGESVKNYDPDTGKFLDTDGSWLAGKNGAAPGIVMEANPKVGDSYNQENAPPVAVDHADVTSLKGTAKLDQFGNLNKLLVTLETNNNEPTTTENKYYAAGVGEVFSQVYESGVLEETEQLVSINGSTQLVQAMASFGANSSGSAAPLTTASSDQPAPLNLLSPPGHHA